jgi:anti-sigma-K factor RskA
MRHQHLTDELQEQASLYAAGAMTVSEQQEYVRHLEDDQCAVCREEVKELQATVSMLAFDTLSVAPSPAVRERLLQQARAVAPPRTAGSAMPFLRRRWLELVTTSAAIGAIVVAMAATQANNEMKRLTDALVSRIAQLEVEVARNQTYVATLTSPDVKVVNLAGQGTNAQANGRIFWDPKDKKWLFYARSLPPVSADRSYELWFVPKTGNPVRAAVFNTEAAGTAQLEIPVPEGLDLRAAAVTTEPAGGTDLPTGPYALLGAM